MSIVLGDAPEVPEYDMDGNKVCPYLTALVINIPGGIALDAVQEFLKNTLVNERKNGEVEWAWVKMGNAVNVDKLLTSIPHESGDLSDNNFVGLTKMELKQQTHSSLKRYETALTEYINGEYIEYTDSLNLYPKTISNILEAVNTLKILEPILEKKALENTECERKQLKKYQDAWKKAHPDKVK